MLKSIKIPELEIVKKKRKGQYDAKEELKEG